MMRDYQHVGRNCLATARQPVFGGCLDVRRHEGAPAADVDTEDERAVVVSIQRPGPGDDGRRQHFQRRAGAEMYAVTDVDALHWHRAAVRYDVTGQHTARADA